MRRLHGMNFRPEPMHLVRQYDMLFRYLFPHPAGRPMIKLEELILTFWQDLFIDSPVFILVYITSWGFRILQIK